MNPQIQSEKSIETSLMIPTETDVLAMSGFSTDEVLSLLYLHNWYQTGGSDRVEVVRRLEFLKMMVMNGKIDL